jgi:O-antigen biosynthesis protein WbqP
MLCSKEIAMTKRKIYCKYTKRILDLILSLVLIVFLLLPMFIIAVVIRADSSGGAVFKQKRIGRGGRIFVCYKFRTMYTCAPHNCAAASLEHPEAYITRVGRLLRRSSLDELPQLFNVLRGDMSLIGPRPLICEEEGMHRQRESVGVYMLRPGITGMAQIQGRNLLSDEEKLMGDTYYLKNVGFSLDLRILLRTVLKVISGEGVGIRGEGRIKK